MCPGSMNMVFVCIHNDIYSSIVKGNLGYWFIALNKNDSSIKKPKYNLVWFRMNIWMNRMNGYMGICGKGSSKFMFDKGKQVTWFLIAEFQK